MPRFFKPIYFLTDMQIKKFPFLAAALLFVVPMLSFAGDTHENHDTGEGKSKKEEIKEYIQHHLQDTHDFHLFSDNTTGKHYGFPLPVILWDEGLHMFMSSAFDHGHKVVESNGKHYRLYHNKIYRTDAEGTLTYDDDHKDDAHAGHGEDVHAEGHDHAAHGEEGHEAKEEAHAEHGHPTNVRPLDFSITKNVFNVILIGLIVFLIFSAVARNYKGGLAPKKAAKFFEPLVIFVRDEIAIPNIGEKHYRKYMGFLLTAFFFIWMVNLFGLTPLGVNVTNNIAVTTALAIMTFLITQFTSKKDYWKHIFWMPGVPYPMRIILAPIELLGVFIKPFALLIRLYANITAGHIVLMSLIGLLFIFQNWLARGAFFGLTIFLSLIELLVAFLQAYIFTMLSALYFGMAVEEHDDHH